MERKDGQDFWNANIKKMTVAKRIDTTVFIVTSLNFWTTGNLEFDSLLEHRHFSAASKPAVGPNPSSFTMHAVGSFETRLKLPPHITDQSHPSSAGRKKI
jgi:hypothetical protein